MGESSPLSDARSLAAADVLLADATGLPPEELGMYLSRSSPGDEPLLRDADRFTVAVSVFERILRRDCVPPYDFASCLRCAVQRVHVPATFDKARRVLWAWASAFHELELSHGTAALRSTDAVVALAFSAVMLSHNLHASGVGSRVVDRNRFVEGCRCLDEVCDVPDAISGTLYDDIAEKPLAAQLPSPLSTVEMAELDAQPVVKEGWLMVKELDSVHEHVSWRRYWMRIYEQHAVLFITPQQWGLDGEMIFKFQLQGLVIASAGDEIIPTSIAHVKAGDELGVSADSPEPSVQPTDPCDGMTGDDGNDSASLQYLNSSSADARCAAGRGIHDESFRKSSFMVLMGSSQLRKDLPRLLMSAAGDANQTRAWAETLIQRVQMCKFRDKLKQALEHSEPAAPEAPTTPSPPRVSKRPKAWGVKLALGAQSLPIPKLSSPAPSRHVREGGMAAAESRVQMAQDEGARRNSAPLAATRARGQGAAEALAMGEARPLSETAASGAMLQQAGEELQQAGEARPLSGAAASGASWMLRMLDKGLDVAGVDVVEGNKGASSASNWLLSMASQDSRTGSSPSPSPARSSCKGDGKCDASGSRRQMASGQGRGAAAGAAPEPAVWAAAPAVAHPSSKALDPLVGKKADENNRGAHRGEAQRRGHGIVPWAVNAKDAPFAPHAGRDSASANLAPSEPRNGSNSPAGGGSDGAEGEEEGEGHRVSLSQRHQRPCAATAASLNEVPANGNSLMGQKSRKDTAVVRGRIRDHLRKGGLWDGLHAALADGSGELASGSLRPTNGCAEAEQGRKGAGKDAGPADGEEEQDRVGDRVRELEAVVRFREWEAKCMREDIKVALNTSLWSSVNGALLHAIGNHVRARHRANCDAFAARRRSLLLRTHLGTWQLVALDQRLERARVARAERILQRHDLGLVRTSLAEWLALVPPPEPAQAHARQVDKPKAAQQDSEGPVVERSGGCFHGLWRYMKVSLPRGGGKVKVRARAEQDAYRPATRMV